MKASLKHMTRDVDPLAAQDLLERVPRASLAYADAAGPCAQPIAFVWLNGRYFVGLSLIDQPPASDQEVVLLVDEGVRFFDLRAIYIRGKVQPAQTPTNAPLDRAWFEVIPFKTVAWDYGTLHEMTNES